MHLGCDQLSQTRDSSGWLESFKFRMAKMWGIRIIIEQKAALE